MSPGIVNRVLPDYPGTLTGHMKQLKIGYGIDEYVSYGRAVI